MDKEQTDRIIQQELDATKEQLKDKIQKLLEGSNGSVQYHKRLAKIYQKILNDVLYEGNHERIHKTSDFYQKIEMFMEYEREPIEGMKDKHIIMTDIYSLIGQVFRSFYINFILYYLEGEDDFFPLPYIGKIKVKEVHRFNHLHRQIIRFFYGGLRLERAVRNDLQKISKNKKIELIDEALKDAKKELLEKIY